MDLMNERRPVQAPCARCHRRRRAYRGTCSYCLPCNKLVAEERNRKQRQGGDRRLSRLADFYRPAEPQEDCDFD